MRYKCCPKCQAYSFWLVKGENEAVEKYKCTACHTTFDDREMNPKDKYAVVRLGRHAYGGPTVYHQSKEAAEKEAARLAAKEKATFAVVRIVSTWALRTVPVTCPLKPAID